MKRLKEQDSYYARVQWSMTVGTLLVVALFYVLGYRATTTRMEDLQIQIAAKERELDANQSRARNLPAVMREVDTLRHRIERFGKQLPRQQDLGQFISSIEELSQEATLRGLTVQPEPPRRNGLYAELPIRLSFEGDFLRICSFLRQAEEMQRLTRVQMLSVRARDASSGRVEVQMLMTVYSTEG
jgi:Tfp pilus assembly protein PilO